MSASRVGQRGERWSFGALSEASQSERIEGAPVELRLLSSLAQGTHVSTSETHANREELAYGPVEPEAFGALAAACHRISEGLNASLGALDVATRTALEPRIQTAQKMARTVRTLLALREEAMGRLRSQGPS